VKQFTGIDSPYESPEKPELIVKTGALGLVESVDKVMAFLAMRGVVNSESLANNES